MNPEELKDLIQKACDGAERIRKQYPSLPMDQVLIKLSEALIWMTQARSEGEKGVFLV